jgi:LysR family glycine cleavage system transcriptional activator
MARLPPIRGLRAFCIAADCLSFKKAAEQLFLTPSAISHQIKQLEEELGFSLFNRHTRSIELTRIGKQFYQAVDPLIGNIESTIVKFTNNIENPTITISLPEFFASELFLPNLREWTEMNTGIDLQLETIKPGESSIKSSNLSIVLSNGTPDATVVNELFPIRYVPACNKNIFEEWESVGFEALNSVPLILHQARQWSWHQWADHNNFNDFIPKQIIQLDSMFGVARAAQRGMGIALVPLPICNDWFQDKQLVKLFNQELVTNDRYYLVQQKNSENVKAISILADWIIQTFQNMT